MATVLSVGDIAIVQYNSGGTTDSFTFVFSRDVEAGTVVNFTDNGWLAAGGFRPGEDTVTYTAPTAITAGTVVTLTGLNLDDAGDQIIAYQGDPATPTILYVVDLADGNNTVAGDATNDNTTALPPGFTLGVNAVAVGFDNAIYAGPIDGSPAQLFPLISNSANWINSDASPPSSPSFRYFYPPDIDLDFNNSTYGGDGYQGEIISGGPPVRISDTDSDIDDFDGAFITFAQINIRGQQPGDVLSVNGTLPFGIFASPFDPSTGILSLFGWGSHADYQTAIGQIRFSTTAPVGTQRTIAVFVFDGFFWSDEADAYITVTSAAAPPVLDLDANNSHGGGADYTATFTSGGPEIPVADTDVSITDADSTTIQSATITIAINRQSGDALIAGALPPGITASSYNPFTGILTLTGSATLAAYQTALHQVVFDTTSTSTADRIIQVTVNDGTSDSNVGTTYMHVVVPPPNVPPALDLDSNDSTTPGANYVTGFTDGGPAVAIVDTDVSVIDNDNPLLASATVTLTNPQALDSLTFNGLPPGSIIVSAGTSVITLTGAASAADYQTALRQITFDNTGTNPSTETRIIDIVVNDGASNSNTAQALIQVEVVNNSAPVLDLDADDSSGSFQSTFRSTFTENGLPVPIADVDTSITDFDSTHLESATITLANKQTGDVLTVSGVLPGTITPTAYDTGTGVLTLTGHATLDEYETALKQIAYSNTSDDPVTGDRLIEVVVNDGANGSNLAVAIISVTATNDAPVITINPSAAYVENAAAVVLAPLATLSDVDDTELNGAVVGITDGSFPGDGDTLSVGGVTSNTVNGITWVWMPAQHALVFTGASLVANYQALLQQVQFQSSSDNPTDFNASPQRTLTWAVTDSASVTTATTTIDITAVNDAPQETVAATAAYTENGSPVTISPAATASDADNSDLIFGEVRIVAGGFDGDVLTVNGLQSGTFAGINFSYDAGSRSLVFDGPAAVADYQALMQQVQFQSTSENPTNFGANPTRTLGWGLADGEDYSSPAQTTQITITALNDAPINTVPGAQSVAEDTTLPIVGVSVADIDSSTLTTTLSVAHGILNVTAGPGVSGNGTASVTIANTTAAQINAALAGLAYTGNLDFNGPDTLTVVTNDGTDTDTDTIAVTVNAVNDAPVLNLDADSSTIGGVDYLTTFTDGGPPVAIVDTDVSIVDNDSPLLASATVTLTNPQAFDSLTFNGLPPGSIVVSGSGTSVITLTGTGAASATDYQTALRQITFQNPDTNPSAETRIIDVVVNDGTAASNTAQAIIEVTQVNDSAPTLDLDGDNTTLPGTSYRTTFTENGPPVAIADTDTLIGDPDIGGTIASATITLTNPQIGDLLTATLPLPGGITASAYDPVTGTLTLSNVASFADYETALEAIRFSAAGDTPVAGIRIIQVVVNDGINDSQPATSLVTVVAANDAPALAVAVNATYQENAAAVLLSPSASLTDADDTDLNFAAVRITAGSFPGDGDTLTVNGATSGIVNGITFTWNPTLHALVFTGASSVANYQALLQTVAFRSTSDNPTDFNASPQRTLTWFVSDGTAVTSATTTLAITAVNDAPINTVPGGQSVAEDTTLSIAGVSVADSDSSALTTTLSVAHGTLNVTAGAGVITGNGTASVAITGTAAEINAALLGLAYTGNLNFNGADPLTVVTNDGTAIDTDTIAITVNPVNDAPINTVPGGQTVAEDTTLPIAGVSVADSDSSALTTTLSVAHGTLHVTAGAGVITGNGTGSVTIAGTAAQINAALAGLAYTGNLNFNGADPLTVATSDGTAADIDTIAITVNPVNDAPINTVPAAQTVAEDTTSSIAGVSVADSDSSALTTTLSVAHGILNVTAGAGVTGNGTASVTITGTAAQINTALAGLAYTGNLNFNGADTLTVATSDAIATDTDTDTIAITVNPVNDAPINTVPGGQTVAEDTTLPIAGVSVADSDSSTLTTLLSVAHGTLNVTAGAGVINGNGTAVVTITGSAVQINTALAGLAYTGNLDFNGADTLTVATIDGTAIDIDTIAITVNPVNDAPALNLDADSSTIGGVDYLTTFTGSAVGIVDTDVSIVDNDSPTLASATVTLTNPQALDSLTFNGPPPGSINVSGSGTSEITLMGTGAASAADYEAALQQITFNTTAPSTETRIIDVVVNDGTADSNIAHAIVEISQVNAHAPTVDLDGDNSTLPGTSYRTTFTENGPPVAIADTDTLVGDPDIGSTTLASATITLTNPQALDSLTFNGAPPGTIAVSGSGTSVITLTGTASFADYETALEAIRFSAAGDTPVAGDRIIEVVVNDGVNDSQAAISLVTVVAANDAPALTVAVNATYQENGAAVSLSPALNLTDADDTELNSAAVQITAGSFPGDGDTLTVNGATSGTVTGITFTWNPTLHALVLTGASSVANYQALLQTVQFQSTSDNPTDFNASPQRALTWLVSDGTAVTSATTTLDIVAGNDAPINTVPGAQSVAEDTTLSIAGVSVADIDSSALTTTLNVSSGKLNVTAGAGAVVTGNGTASVIIAGTAAQINTALVGLAYTGNPDFNGADILTVVTNDGTAPDITDTIAITVNPVNDAPINTVPGAQTVAEDTTLPIAGVSVADIDSSTLTTTLSVSSGRLHVTAGAGVTGNDTASVTIANTTAAEINTALVGLAYTGNLNFNGADTLTVATSDGTAADIDTIAITVNPVNDAPINTVPGGQTVAEDTTLPIAGVSVADSDSSALTTTLSVAHGTLHVTAGAGVITGNGTGSVTIAGTAAQINAALAGLAYTGNLNFNGADPLTVATSDGTATDTDTIAITVNPVNDAPINTVPGAQSVAEDTTLPIVGVAVADSDSSTLTTLLSVAHGTLNVTAGAGVITGNGTAVVTIAGTAAQINTALAGLAYTGNLNFNGADTLTVATIDGTAADIDTIAITVNAVNDPPVLNLDADSSTIGGVDYLTTFTGSAVGIVDTDVSIVDNDSPTLASATVTLTNPQALDILTFTGPLPGSIIVAGSGTSEITLTGTGAASAADYQTALLQITFDNTGTNPSTETRIIDVVVNDGTAASNIAHAIIEVVEDNASAPTVDLDGDNSTLPGTSYRTTFTENGPPVAIADTDTLVGDPDIGSTTLASATITLTSPQIGDLLTATLPLPGGIIASAYDPVTGTLTLSNVASFTDYETALEAIRFSAAGGNPVAGTRIIEVVVNDGVNDSQAAISLVTVVAANSAPVLVVADATYHENAAPVLLSQSASLTDADDTELNFAAVQITAGSFPGDGDTLTVNGATSGTVNGITFTWNPTLHALVLTGASLVANYQALLQTVAFRSTSDNPTGSNASPQRTLTWFVSDGTAVTTATTTLAITAANDAPINTVPGAQTLAEDTILPIAGVSVADIDSSALIASSALTTTLSVAHGILNVTAGSGVTGNGTASVTIAGPAAQINTALAGLAYAGNLNFNGPDTLTVATSDGTATDIDTIAITVTPVNIFEASTFELPAFGPDAGNWISDDLYPRELADVNNDGMADIVGFAQPGVLVSLATGDGHFAPSTFELPAFGPNAGGWSSDDTYPREVADVNNDGMADIVGFASTGVFVSLATGDGHFAPSTFELPAFGPDAGWSSDDTYPRELADVNGDGMADIVGFASTGVFVSLATGDGHFAPSTFELPAFGPDAGGWSSDDTYPRELADVNGDGKADIVGFASTGVLVSLATGDGHFAPSTFELPAFGPDAGGWSSDDTYLRELADVNGDGKADIVGFASTGVVVSLANDLFH